MSVFQQVAQMAARQGEVDRLRAIIKAAATVLTKRGYPTKVSFGAPTGGAQANRPKAGAGKKAGGAKKLRRRSDGVLVLDEGYGSSEDTLIVDENKRTPLGEGGEQEQDFANDFANDKLDIEEDGLVIQDALRAIR